MTRLRTAAQADGTITYELDQSASELPPVRSRDLLAAWDLAGEAARRSAWDGRRAFRFRSQDGSWTDLALQDRDAMCWAGAVDRTMGLHQPYGLSVCLRLLALVALLERAPWAQNLVGLQERGARLSPALMKLAAEARLTDEAGFDEVHFRDALIRSPGAATQELPS